MNKPLLVTNIRLHQSVRWKKKEEDYFNSTKRGMANIEAVLEGNRVYIKDSETKDVIILFTTNVASLEPIKMIDIEILSQEQRFVLDDMDEKKRASREASTPVSDNLGKTIGRTETR